MSEQVTPAVQETPEPSKAKSAAAGAGKKILGYVVAAAVVFGGYTAYNYLTGDITIAKAGDCVNNATDVDDVKVVDCTSADAARKVAGVLENKTQADYDRDGICDAFPTTEYIIFVGKTNNGDIWCLEPLKK
ncbi:LppU/SCO3897 family protein [Catellatospora vulcania]|uniref:LppU/SCO3897 family protein n=1 Tax=Catellatospora vulcania TaxID=1460450 RepID=UPI0012D479A9|nr:hypothetical protein [Catellatospora vulcania]